MTIGKRFQVEISATRWINPRKPEVKGLSCSYLSIMERFVTFAAFFLEPFQLGHIRNPAAERYDALEQCQAVLT